MKGCEAMKEPISIVILNHGKFGEELISSAELIFGKIDDIQAVSLLTGMSIEEYCASVRTVIESLVGQKIILTDVYGGTPSNVALLLQKNLKIEIVCGVNLPMLLELLSLREQQTDLGKIVNSIIEAGKSAIFQPERVIIKED